MPSLEDLPVEFLGSCFATCVAPGDTYVQAICLGRHRVENRVGKVQTRGGVGRGGVGWGGVVTYFAGRTGTMV